MDTMLKEHDKLVSAFLLQPQSVSCRDALCAVKREMRRLDEEILGSKGSRCDMHTRPHTQLQHPPTHHAQLSHPERPGHTQLDDTRVTPHL